MSLTDADRRLLEQRRRALLDRLRGLGSQINGYYPRPAGSSAPAGEERLREQARSVEQRLAEIRELLDGDEDHESLTAELAESLLLLWQLAGGECEHGRGGLTDCPDETCHYNLVRPALRRAYALAGEAATAP